MSRFIINTRYKRMKRIRKREKKTFNQYDKHIKIMGENHFIVEFINNYVSNILFYIPCSNKGNLFSKFLLQ